MLKKRIIPCLDIKGGRTVKGHKFVSLRDAGDPVDLALKYAEQGADELVFLDISATLEQRKTTVELVEKVARVIDIPFTVGGGVKDIQSAKELLEAGADKISVNSAAVKRPQLINELAEQFGSQCVVLAIDSKREMDKDMVYISGGTKATGLNTLEWAKKGIDLGAGEILLTSMDKDGDKSGFNVDLYRLLSSELSIPIIASGGAGNIQHFEELFAQTDCSGGLAASIFHFGEVEIEDLKTYLKNKEIPVR